MTSVPSPGVPAGVVAKAFLGGPLSDYRVILGKGGTLLSEHIPSGKKVPAVEVMSLARSTLSTAAQFARFGRGRLAVGAAAATVATGFAIYEARKQRTQDADAPAAGPADATSAPILVPEKGGPILVGSTEPQPRTVSAPESGDRPPKSRRRSSPSQPVTHPAVPHTLQAADPAHTAEEPAEVTAPGAGVDWTAVAGTEVTKARKEHAEGRTGEAVERLRQLLLYLDEVPGKNGSPVSPAITFAPLSALVEFAEATDGSASGAWSATEVAQWMDCLENLAETEDLDHET